MPSIIQNLHGNELRALINDVVLSENEIHGLKVRVYLGNTKGDTSGNTTEIDCWCNSTVKD